MSIKLPQLAAVWRTRLFLWPGLILIVTLSSFWAFQGQKLQDFGSFVAAARAQSAGENPYAPDLPLVFHVSLPALGVEVDSPNLNPPISLMLFAPLSRLDPYTAVQAWRCLSLGLYLLALGLLVRYTPRPVSALKVAWALSLAGLWNTIELGQIYMLLLLACVVSWILLRARHELLAGLGIGLLVAIKPNFIVWPLALALAGSRLAALASLATAGLLSLLPVLIYGPPVYREWLAATARYTATSLGVPTNSSLAGLLAQFELAGLGTLLGFLLLISLGLWIWRKRPGRLEASALALAAALLASPVAWPGYTLLLLPVLFERNWKLPHFLVGILLTVPVFIVLGMAQDSAAYHLSWNWVYGWAILVFLAGELVERWRLTGKALNSAWQPAK